MANKYQCLRCQQIFPKKYNLEKHLKRKNPCQLPTSIDETLDTLIQSNCDYLDEMDCNDLSEINCPYCQIRMKYRKNLKRHYETCSKYPGRLVISQQDFHDQINKLKTEFQQQLDELKQQPRIVEQHNQNILQVVCIGNNDNYLDMLTEQWGFDRALGFIKDCALSQLSGDCKLLEKIYFNNQSGEVPIKYLNKSRTKIEFIDEKHQRVIDVKGVQLSRRLANNLQNSYLKGVNYLINKNLNNKCCPNKFLEEYDLQSWNQHIYDLSDVKYHRKILTQLEIPYQ